MIILLTINLTNIMEKIYYLKDLIILNVSPEIKCSEYLTYTEDNGSDFIREVGLNTYHGSCDVWCDRLDCTNEKREEFGVTMYYVVIETYSLNNSTSYSKTSLLEFCSEKPIRIKEYYTKYGIPFKLELYIDNESSNQHDNSRGNGFGC